MSGRGCISSGAWIGRCTAAASFEGRAAQSGFLMLDGLRPQRLFARAALSFRAKRFPDNAVWLDLVNPVPGEDKVVERLLGIAVPTREEMQEIEVSSRLYVENHARYMTATLMCNSDTAAPKTTAVTFILVRPSPGHGALRRSAAVHDRRQQARPQLPGQRHRRDRAARSARRRDRPRCRHSRAHRHGGRPGLARHLRARRARQTAAAVLQGHPQGDRQQGRPDLEGAREPGLDRPAAAVPRQRGRGHALAQGCARCNCRRCSATCCRCPTTPPI